MDPAQPFFRTALAGACATASGVGLARFAFVPLFPAMVLAGWVDGPEAGLLGAANFAGYLGGALSGQPVSRRLGSRRTFDVAMAITALAFAACAWNGGLVWFALWRGLAGLSGGVMMSIAGPAVQEAVETRRRGLASGIVIAGVGSGIVIASLAVPAFLSVGLGAAWIGLAALVGVLWAIAHPHWPRASAGPAPAAAPLNVGARIVVIYALAGAGMAPHMVYLADWAVRGLGLDATAAGGVWALFGLGAIIGTLTGGRFFDRLGAVAAVRLWLAAQIVALAVVLAPSVAALILSTFLGGFAGIGISGVVMAWARQTAGSAAGSLWARATAGFAVAQAATAFALAALFAQVQSHRALFMVGLLLTLAAFVVELSTPRQAGPTTSQREKEVFDAS